MINNYNTPQNEMFIKNTNNLLNPQNSLEEEEDQVSAV